MFREAMHSEGQTRSSESGWLELRVSTWVAYLVYLLYTFLVYWPVFWGKRFLWEDFFGQEYPIREYSFYMAGLRHALPFWNPYSWGWGPLIADAQNGFWYPTNLLGIAITRLLFPSATHLPVLIPEAMTLLHLSIASLGVFVLLKSQFRVAPVVALIAGFAWGFGARMVAEQNHPMQVIQLSLLPWEVLLTMCAWNSWKYAIGLGLQFGISFFAGQPQTFLYIAIFLGALTLSESVQRFRDGKSWQSVAPLGLYSLSVIVALGVAAIQILPMLELLALSAREHLSYEEAGIGAIHLGHFLNFFVPKFYGENPGFGFPASATVNDHFWYWESTYYWGALAEILALFGVVQLWKKHRVGIGKNSRNDPKLRHIAFLVCFSIFSLAFGMGGNLHLQWLFWRFVPLFDHIRAPNRMIWFFWFIGVLATAFGLEELVRSLRTRGTYKRLLLWSSGILLLMNVLASVGIFDLIFAPHTVRDGLWRLIFHSLVASIAAIAFCVAYLRGWLSTRWIVPIAALLMLVDLYYVDTTWHRNTLNRVTVVARDSSSQLIRDFRRQHTDDHSKLLILKEDSARKIEANLGMFLRLPIEYANDEEGLHATNPLCLRRTLPQSVDTVRRMEIMGVRTCLTNNGRVTEYAHGLPFAKLYHKWIVGRDTAAEARILNDSNFDFEQTILLDMPPQCRSDSVVANDSLFMERFSENELRLNVRPHTSCVLLINDLYYPAWKATVDGNPVHVFRAFGCLRAVPVPSGFHRVEMRYESDAFDLGWKITLSVMLFAGIALSMGKKRQKK